ncbi:hypothetical protein [Burkholderia contaminans]|uniref:hypothetical protein n=1 Tax=Burkholderia contaminans TaxID=488447 RepID=UPI001452F979|nr:hypothetical protein [Burkholderia contaminans]VWD20227.1 hypothetical protein BCO18442_03861 [Burkholderia contaminans]
MNKTLADAIARYDETMSHVTGCSDGGCVIRRPVGMHTNGGCRCPRDSMKMHRAMHAANELRRALDEVLATQPPEARASAGVIAAARAVIEADRAQTLTTEHVNALDNAIKIQRGELALPEPRALADLQAEIDRLNAIINTPHNDDFYKGVSIEEEYQRQLHGVDTSDARFDWVQYLWVTGYLLNKALAACKTGEGDGEKAKHHLITSAAIIKNWHNVLTGKPAASVHSNAGREVAQRLAGDAS